MLGTTIRTVLQFLLKDMTAEQFTQNTHRMDQLKHLLDSATQDLDRYNARGNWHVFCGTSFTYTFTSRYSAEYVLWDNVSVVFFYC
jgi:hypothetical protein